MKNSKLSSYIGLSQRAGAVLYGEDIILEKIKTAKVVLISSEAPIKYKERLNRKLNGKVEIFECELSEAIHRDNVNAIAITNEGLATAIINLMR